MWIHKPRRVLVFAPLVFIAGLCPCPLVLSQTETGRGPGSGNQAPAMIFKGGVSSRQVEKEKRLSAPPKLTSAQVTKILVDLKLPPTPGSLYAKLTAQHPIEPNKAHLLFKQPHLIDIEANFGNWATTLETVPGKWEVIGNLTISLKAEVGRRYLFDCSVFAHNPNSAPFKVLGPNKLVQSVAPTYAKGQHLVFILEATDNGWYDFYISRKSHWYFYSCEVTNL